MEILVIRDAFIEPDVIGTARHRQIVLSHIANGQDSPSLVYPLVDFRMSIGKREVATATVVITGREVGPIR